LIIVINPENILNSTIKEIKRKKIKIVCWLGDDPLSKNGLLNNIFYYDRIFCVDRNWAKEISYFYSNSYYLPHAADTQIFKKINSQKYKNDIVFIGDSFNGYGNGFLRAGVIKNLFDNGFNIKVYGDNGWKKLFLEFPFLKNVFINKIVSPQELNEIYNTSKIVLNIHHSQFKTGANQRTFEIASAGAFQLTDFKDSIKEYFDDTLVTFDSPIELVKKAKYYIENEKERKSLALKAQNIVSAHHTYKNRIDNILNT
ncbi:MAG: CgeB family protein, partial [Minisyncoccota bacterium]